MYRTRAVSPCTLMPERGVIPNLKVTTLRFSRAEGLAEGLTETGAERMCSRGCPTQKSRSFHSTKLLV